MIDVAKLFFLFVLLVAMIWFVIWLIVKAPLQVAALGILALIASIVTGE